MMYNLKHLFILIKYSYSSLGNLAVILIYLLLSFLSSYLESNIGAAIFGSSAFSMLTQIYYQMEYAGFFGAAPGKERLLKTIDFVTILGNLLLYVLLSLVFYGNYLENPTETDLKYGFLVIATSLSLIQIYTGIMMKTMMGAIGVMLIEVVIFAALNYQYHLRGRGYLEQAPATVVWIAGVGLVLLGYPLLRGVRKLVDKLPISPYSIGQGLHKKMNA